MASDGTFVLADIGGYTGFLTGVGIEHAKEITSHLLNSLLKCNSGRWKLANVEGDCLFLYREGREPPEELLEHVRALYEDFCDRTLDIAVRASCPCGACSRTNELSLKFIVHAGEFDRQKIANREELIGRDVVLAHRLLKNSVPLSEYTLLTREYSGESAVTGAPFREGRDDFGDVGPVEYRYIDLRPVREEVDARRRFFVSESEAAVVQTIDIQAPPELVWWTMNDREKRTYVLGQEEITELPPARGGKIGEVHRCVHGDGKTSVEVMTAFDEEGHRFTMRAFPTRLVKDVYFTMGADPLPGGASHVYFHMRLKEAVPLVSHLMRPIIVAMVNKEMRGAMGRLKAVCEEEATRRAA
ncbi:MAG: DUF2652 domain-containing protein [Chloroflexi bacterium]|nr:MAG: DUF2652 domain-containing protein [Chloroflexota bacterium]